jgi:RNA polymerase sigma-70 factor, ECF subfamily
VSEADTAWIETALTSARPQAVGALLRYFRDLDTAEEAFQNACLRALKTWPQNGPPRDPSAWLIMVGRNVAIDEVRRTRKQQPLPEDDQAISDLDDAEGALAERLDGSHYRDDILRLMFICCHPGLPATQQIALALRIVCGLTVKQIARAFLVSEAAMEQRITRAKAKVAEAGTPFETPGAVERSERLAVVAAMIYLIFNEGYSASGDTAEIRKPLCEEAIRLARLLLRLFQSEPEIMGLTALILLQHARSASRFAADGSLILLDDQDRSLWNGTMIAEGLALIDKAIRHRRSGPYQIQAAIAALHARASTPEETDWAQIDLLYGALEVVQPSPVVTLNRAVAVSKVRGPQAALDLIEPLAPKLANYFHFYGVRGAFLMQLGRNDEARIAFDRAIALANTSAEAAHIRMHLDRLIRDSQPKGANGGARQDAKVEGAKVK